MYLGSSNSVLVALHFFLKKFFSQEVLLKSRILRDCLCRIDWRIKPYNTSKSKINGLIVKVLPCPSVATFTNLILN